MTTMKKTLLLFIVTIFSIMLIACGGEEAPAKTSTTTEVLGENANDSFTIKVATWFADGHPQILALQKFKEDVESRTDGNVQVQIYGNSQLGSEDAFIPAVKNGTVEMGVPGTMVHDQGSPLIAVMDMPFLFSGWEHAKEALQGEIGAELLEPLLDENIRGLAWTVNGFRQISSNKPIKSMEDFQSIKLRVPNVPYFIEMGKGLGVNPVTMSLSELFPALEQNAVDGQDNPYPTVLESKFYEVQDYVLESRHIFAVNPWIMNETFFQSLPEQYQDVIDQAAKDAAAYNWEVSMKAEEEAKQKLIDEGLEIIVPDEQFRQQLIASQQDVEKWFYDQYEGAEELVKRIRELDK